METDTFSHDDDFLRVFVQSTYYIVINNFDELHSNNVSPKQKEPKNPESFSSETLGLACITSNNPVITTKFFNCISTIAVNLNNVNVFLIFCLWIVYNFYFSKNVFCNAVIPLVSNTFPDCFSFSRSYDHMMPANCSVAK